MYDIRTTTIGNQYFSGLLDWPNSRFVCSVIFDLQSKTRMLQLPGLAGADLTQVVTYVNSFPQMTCKEVTAFIGFGLSDLIRAKYVVMNGGNTAIFEDAASAIKFANANNTQIAQIMMGSTS